MRYGNSRCNFCSAFQVRVIPLCTNCRSLDLEKFGPGDHSDIAKVVYILHVINFNDVIGAQFSTSWEYATGAQKKDGF